MDQDQSAALHPGGSTLLPGGQIPKIGLVGELTRRLRASPFAADVWVALGNEFLHRRDFDEAEICFLAAMYLFSPIPKDLQRVWFQVYSKRRIRNDVKESQAEQMRTLQATANVSIPKALAMVRESETRLRQELIVCINALEVDHGGV